ncbi:hypothetical protein STVIR_7614 [Streptomyces viridochromogenes Tue57]|uniref:Uncharacterized protein n=1 Tax=Streptomyces viridochromogenes Tue57 TaxID=1160705 RepID=L8P4L9_STRVR|nr:hypothetical protein STVIR_7614 [Streptomyces viridochromogenes Tue57]
MRHTVPEVSGVAGYGRTAGTAEARGTVGAVDSRLDARAAADESASVSVRPRGTGCLRRQRSPPEAPER